MDLSGVAAMVTGAGRGLGRGVAVALAGWGAHVAVLDIDGDAAAAVAEELQAAGGQAWGRRLDVTDEGDVEEAVAACERELGGLDLVVNNAGVLSTVVVAELSLAEWRRVLEVNATGVFLVSRAAVRSMLAREVEGSIVAIASIAGKVGDPGLAHYSASKFAVVGFTQALAREVAARGITVNAVCPGLVETAMIRDLEAGWQTTTGELLAAQAIPRPQRPDEIAQAIAFLHRCRAVTGQAVNVDGGTVFH